MMAAAVPIAAAAVTGLYISYHFNLPTGLFTVLSINQISKMKIKASVF